MIKKLIVLVFFVSSGFLFAQEEPDAIALANDEFQNNFYESLKQKGIENYDKAILSLEKCLTLDENNPTVYYELGKNYLNLKNYKNAENAFEKATKLIPNNKWYWVGLYEVYFKSRQYAKAITVLDKIITFDLNYQDELVMLYMYTQQYDKALSLIDELSESLGKSERRSQYRAQILSMNRYKIQEKERLIELINKHPYEEIHYITLIDLYNQNNEIDKAFEIAQELASNIPTSEWAQISLYKHFLEQNQHAQAVLAMQKVISSPLIDDKIKHRVLNEFLNFVYKNPGFQNDLDKAISLFGSSSDVNVAKEVGKYYQEKSNMVLANKYYEVAFAENNQEIELTSLLLQSYVAIEDYEKLQKTAISLIDFYPLQPDFYYYAGFGLNKKMEFKKAQSYLEMGLDYLVENKPLERLFYEQLVIAFKGLNNPTKAAIFEKKLQE
uniref:tetratricopeptide repeat protein n=1 Tax=Flavobacterium sp. TaxID=239 RepID=UPI004049E0C2